MPASKPDKGKPFPHFTSDEEMEQFVDTADLSEYDFSEFKPMSFYLKRKDARVNMRMPASLLNSVKSAALAEKVPYQRLMRDFIEKGLAGYQANKPAKKPRRKKAS